MRGARCYERVRRYAVSFDATTMWPAASKATPTRPGPDSTSSGALSGRSPNQERYWKSVVAESERWRPWYEPLARLDAWLLRVLPPLRWWCWNVVIVARDPRPAG